MALSYMETGNEKNHLFSILSVWMERMVSVSTPECTASAVAAPETGPGKSWTLSYRQKVTSAL
jgi:hypothetical protein